MFNVSGMTSWRSVTLTEKVVTQLYKTNPTWSKRHVQSLLPKCSVIHSTKFYSTHIVKSPYKDCDIPEVTLNEYLFSRFEKFADYPAVVSNNTPCGFPVSSIHISKQFRNFIDMGFMKVGGSRVMVLG